MVINSTKIILTPQKCFFRKGRKEGRKKKIFKRATLGSRIIQKMGLS
jgi:hypothetical protein